MNVVKQYSLHDMQLLSNNNHKEDFYSAHLPFKVGAQGALQ